MYAFLDWLGTTPFSLAIQNPPWMVPSVQAVHILAIAVVFTSALMVNLRLLGLAQTRHALSQLTDRFAAPIGWGVVVLLATGLLLIVAEPTRALFTAYFQVKMAALVVVGILTWWVARRPQYWSQPHRRGAAKAIALVSLGLWALIIVAGRWIAYSA